MPNLILTNKRVGTTVYICDVEKKKLPCGISPRRILVKCDCGKTKELLLLHWIRGRIKCICITKKEKHGDVGSKLHNTWRAMKNRCSKNYFQKKYYYEKNISVCDKWKMYSEFKKWALLNNYKDGLQIDRIDNSKGYYPENCRFVTQEENMANRDVTIKIKHNGELVPLTKMIKIYNKDNYYYNNVLHRINRGWDYEKAFFTPTRNGNYKRKNN